MNESTLSGSTIPMQNFPAGPFQAAHQPEILPPGHNRWNCGA
jgi:hypothetical protein